MKRKVSIIIPVYNKQDYIKRCLDSVIAQSYCDIEIIIVEDGSTDESLRICKEYERSDQRVHVLAKKNGGVSSARNYGLEHSRGDKVVFVDGDDYLEKDCIQKMMEYSENELVVCGYIKESGKQQEVHIPTECMLKQQKEMEQYVFTKANFIYFAVPYLKLYDATIIRTNQLSFASSLSYGEDTLFVLQYLSYISSMKVIKEALYINRVVSEGLSRSYVTDCWLQLHHVTDYAWNHLSLSKGSMTYLVMRQIKLSLRNDRLEYRRLNSLCKTIKSSKEFDQIRVQYGSKIDRLIYWLLKYRLTPVLFIIFQMEKRKD